MCLSTSIDQLSMKCAGAEDSQVPQDTGCPFSGPPGSLCPSWTFHSSRPSPALCSDLRHLLRVPGFHVGSFSCCVLVCGPIPPTRLSPGPLASREHIAHPPIICLILSVRFCVFNRTASFSPEVITFPHLLCNRLTEGALVTGSVSDQPCPLLPAVPFLRGFQKWPPLLPGQL